MGHPWLQGDEGSPSPAAAETLPKHPDPAILAAMSNLGYRPHEIRESLLNSTFNEVIATYLTMLRQQT
jgi:hypothetical protein